MARCPRRGGEFAAGELARDERASLVLVHCPDCKRLPGRYRDRSARP